MHALSIQGQGLYELPSRRLEDAISAKFEGKLETYMGYAVQLHLQP